jgi:hypothetical protein
VLYEFVTFKFYQVFITDIAVERLVLECLVEPVFHRLNKYFLAGCVQKATVQFAVEMLRLNHFFVQHLENHAVNYYRLENFRNVKTQRIPPIAR